MPPAKKLLRILQFMLEERRKLIKHIGGENKKKAEFSIFFLSNLIPAHLRTHQPWNIVSVP